MKPKNQKKIVFENTCECIVDYELLEKAILWYSNDNVFSKRKIYMHGRYPAISIYKEKIHIHRIILMYLNKEKINRSIVCHHKNGDRKDCSINNIELMSSTLHAKHHNKGKKLSKIHKLKISEANRKRKGIKIRRKYNIDISDLKIYLESGMSINSIAKIYGCDWSVIKKRIIENPEILENRS